MIGSLFAGISGLNANATAMTVIGDNIANVNTTAFKSNRASFSNILSESLAGSPESQVIGRGAHAGAAVDDNLLVLAQSGVFVKFVEIVRSLEELRPARRGERQIRVHIHRAGYMARSLHRLAGHVAPPCPRAS